MNERLRFFLLGPRLKSRRARLARNGFLGLVAAWILFTYEPRIGFAHEALHERFVFRSDAPIDSNIATVLDRAAGKLRASGIDDPSLRSRLYACNERWRCRLIAPFSSNAFGVNSAGRMRRVFRAGSPRGSAMRSPVSRLFRWRRAALSSARAGEEDPSPGFSYLRARLMVELLREEGLSWDEIVERRHDEGEVLARLRARLR